MKRSGKDLLLVIPVGLLALTARIEAIPSRRMDGGTEHRAGKGNVINN